MTSPEPFNGAVGAITTTTVWRAWGQLGLVGHLVGLGPHPLCDLADLSTDLTDINLSTEAVHPLHSIIILFLKLIGHF